MGLFAEKKNRHHIAIDIGTRSIKALIFEAAGSAHPPKGLKKMVIPLRSPKDVQQTLSALHEFLFSVTKETERLPEKITLGFGAEAGEMSLEAWTTTALAGQADISHAALCTNFERLFSEHRDPKRMMLAYPVDMTANDFDVDTATLLREGGRTIKEITFRTLLLSLDGEFGSGLYNLKNMFGGITMEFVPMIAAYREAIVRSLAVENFFFANIGAEATLLMLIKNRRLAGFTTFNLGAEHFTDEIVKAKKISQTQAGDLKRQYAQGSMDKDESLKISRMMNPAFDEWKSLLLSSLDSFYHLGPMPPDIYLCGGGSYLPEIRGLFASPEIMKNYTCGKSCSVRLVMGSTLFQGDAVDGFLKGQEDAGLAALVYYSLYHQPMFT